MGQGGVEVAEKAGNRCHVLRTSEDRDKDRGPTDEADGVQAAGHSHSWLKRSGEDEGLG